MRFPFCFGFSEVRNLVTIHELAPANGPAAAASGGFILASGEAGLSLQHMAAWRMDSDVI